MTINFGQTIRQIRLAKGITQPEIYAGVMSRSFYSEFEHNRHHIRVDQFIALLKNLNVDISEFLFIANHYDVDDENELTQLVNDLYNERNISALLPLSENIDMIDHAIFVLSRCAPIYFFMALVTIKICIL